MLEYFARMTARNNSKRKSCIEQGYNFEYAESNSNIANIIQKYV